MTMGHSLGEYGALVAAGALPFEDALEAVSARGREMTRVAMEDNGRMAAVFAPLDEIERILKTVDGYVVIANINSEHQAVIGGASQGSRAGHGDLPAGRLQRGAVARQPRFPYVDRGSGQRAAAAVLERLHLQSPRVPIVANVNGEFYPTGPDVVPQMLDILAQQVASPVQFVKGLQHAVRRRRAHVRGSGPEEGPAGIRRGRARRARRRRFALHQSSQGRRYPGVQPGVVRPVRGRIGPWDGEAIEVSTKSRSAAELPRR